MKNGASVLARLLLKAPALDEEEQSEKLAEIDLQSRIYDGDLTLLEEQSFETLMSAFRKDSESAEFRRKLRGYADEVCLRRSVRRVFW